MPKQIIEIVKKSINKQIDIKEEEIPNYIYNAKKLIHSYENNAKELIPNYENDVKELFLIEKIKKWKAKRRQKKQCQNRIPIENVQMVYNIGNILKDKHVFFEKEFFNRILKEIYITIKNELKKRDNYLKELGIKNKNYEEIFFEYPIIRIFLDDMYGDALQKILSSIFMPSSMPTSKSK